MTPEKWGRIQEVLSAALDTEPVSRPAMLAAACAGDQSLRDEVESLLAFETEADQAVSSVVRNSTEEFGAEGLGLHKGERVGAYRIVRELGRGGMGTVYLAERDDDNYQKRVAIKLVTRGMDTAALLGRFRHERQILARLEHPYIARLLDGGSTADGRPYLVMEYVEGKPITVYCSENRLGIDERIELFRKVCAAVQSAHQNLVVHRDLKPGNILVDLSGSPKLLDFGVAKLLDSGETGQVTMAGMGLQMLTPDYASPEQVRREAINTSTDVYSLGAILYELLAGVRPHRLLNYSMTEIERVVCRVDPEKPSQAWKNSPARGEAPPLKPGELDNIVLMAMQKEPGRRYGSPAELSDDLYRYLEARPVRARQDTVSYRARKFIRRNRTGIAAAVLLVASLAGGAIFSTIQARRAQHRFSELRGIAHAVLFNIYDEISDLPGSVKAREVVVKTAMQYLDGLARDAGGDSDIQLELAEAYQRVGDVQGAAMGRSLGQTAEALKSYRKALAISDRLSAGKLETPQGSLVRIRVRERLGDMAAKRGNDLAGGLLLYRQAAAIGEAAVTRYPANTDIRRALASQYLALAREDPNSTQSVASARKGLEIVAQLASADSTAEMRNELADGYSILGSALTRDTELRQALVYYEKTVRVREELVAAYPLNARYQRQLMIGYSKVGDISGLGYVSLHDTPRATENYRKMLALADKLAAGDPSDVRAKFDRGVAIFRVASVFPPDRDQEAISTFQKALAIFDGLSSADSHDQGSRIQAWTTRRVIADRLFRMGDKPAALRAYREVLPTGVRLISENRKNLSALRMMMNSYRDMAVLLADTGQRVEALAMSKKGIDLALAGHIQDPDNAMTQAWTPRAYASAAAIQARFAVTREEWAQALSWYEQSVEQWKSIHPQNGWPEDRDSELSRVQAEAARCVKTLAAFH